MSEQIRLIPAREGGAILDSAMTLHKPSKSFVLFSGGKDSSVTLDYIWREHGDILTGALHINTGIGLKSTNQFARQFCEERGIPFHEALAPIAYEDLVRRGWLSGAPGAGGGGVKSGFRDQQRTCSCTCGLKSAP